MPHGAQRLWMHLFYVCIFLCVWWAKTRRPPIYTGRYTRSGISLVYLWIWLKIFILFIWPYFFLLQLLDLKWPFFNFLIILVLLGVWGCVYVHNILVINCDFVLIYLQVAELREELIERGLNAKGNKQELIDRLTEHIVQGGKLTHICYKEYFIVNIIVQIMNVCECNGTNISWGERCYCSIHQSQAELNGTFHLSPNDTNEETLICTNI